MLIPRPASDKKERMCQCHWSDQIIIVMVLVQNSLSNHFINYIHMQFRVFGINHLILSTLVTFTIKVNEMVFPYYGLVTVEARLSENILAT